MRRALFLASFSAVLAAGVCFAQTKKASTSKPAARQQLSPAPVAGPGAPAVPAHPNPYNVYGAQYPRIEEDNRVTFHFTAPTAQKVQVALVTSGQGSLNPLPYDMVKGADGIWTYTSVPQGPGYHNYWMLVDGAIVLDPATKAFMGYSHMCNGYEIPEAGVDWYDLKDVPHGHVEAANYFAKSIHAWRHIFIYTPPGYGDKANSNTRYPVVYLQHGSGEDETVWFEMGRTNLVLDNLLAAGKVKPMIVVSETSIIPRPVGGRRTGCGGWRRCCAGDPWRNARSRPRPRGGFGGGPGGGAYGQLMTNELIPWVDSHFRTVAEGTTERWAGSPWAAESPRPSPWSTSISSRISGYSAAAAQPGSVAAAVAVEARRQAQLRQPRPRSLRRLPHLTSRLSIAAQWPIRRSSTGGSRFSS